MEVICELHPSGGKDPSNHGIEGWVGPKACLDDMERQIYCPYRDSNGAWIAQSAQRLATGWMTERSEFKSRKGQEFSLFHIMQTGSGVHPTSYTVANGGLFPRG
jgi:hypothetical protein